MKKLLFFTSLLLLVNLLTIAQSPQSFRYQAIARNNLGDVILNQLVRFKINLIQGTNPGNVIYSETHAVTTNAFGLANLSIGTGTVLTGTFSTINWSVSSYYIKIELDINGGSSFADMGTSQLLSVPYALFAASGNQGPQGSQGIQGPEGASGLDGVGIVSAIVQNDSLNITLSTGQILNTGQVRGAQGNQGIQGLNGNDGVSVSGTYLLNDSLIITLSDNTTVNVGHVRGQQGLQGQQGPAGTGLNNRGTWANGIVYNPSDYVFDRSTNDINVNSMWISQASAAFISTIHPFGDLINWVEFQAPAGQQGIQGIQGSQGIQGIQGLQGMQGPQGNTGANGISLTWVGTYSAAPSDPVLNDAYYNSTSKISYIWNGNAWQIIVQDGVDGANGVDGTNGALGPQGPQGIQGQQGITGANGSSITWLGSIATVPVNPSLNEAYYNTTDKISYIFNGNAWQILAQDGATGLQGLQGTQGLQGIQGPAGSNGISLVWLGTSASAPVNPSTNQAYYNSSTLKSYIWAGGAWQIIAQDGAQGIQGLQGTQGVDGANGTDGVSVIWLGTSASAPINPTTNQAYYNSADKKSYIWNGSWQIITQDGAQGSQGSQGIQGYNGTNGNNGTNGQTILHGSVNPVSEGVNGDFYINTTSNMIFGPKNTVWGNGTSIIGSQGSQGIQGPAGTGLTNKGNWLTGSSYSNGDYVFSRSTASASVNSMWICQTTAFTSSTLPWQDATHWVEFQAPAGQQGVQGAQGIQGVQGPAGTYSAGTGIGISNGTISNSAPDQTVILTGSGATNVTGTYPNFTISSTDNNSTYSAGTGLLLTANTFSANFGTSSTQIAQGNHTHSTDHTRLHSITSTNDHSAGNWKLFYSNGLGQINEMTFGTSGQMLSSTGANTSPAWITPVSGTVTSVGLSMPSVFNVTGSPITSSGTLTADFTTQTANYVFAGPTTGTASTPTFRALVASDIPTHNQSWSTITSTPTTLLNYGITDAVPFNRTISITGTANQITLSAGSQDLSTNRTWTVSLSNNPIIPGNASLTFPTGTTAQRPVSGANGMARYNTNNNKFEFYENGAWSSFPGNATGFVNASSAANYIPKFDGSANLDTSLMYQNGKKIGLGTTTPSGRFMIQQDANAADNEPIFEVKDKSNQTVMVVYKDSTHFYVKDPGGAKTATRGSFAVSGKSSVKSFTNNYLFVNPDSTRIYTTDTVAGFGVKNIQASSSGNYLKLNPKNYLIGHDAGKSLTTGTFNSMIGYSSGKNLTTGSDNTYMGYQSAYSDNKGRNNVFIGYQTGYKTKGRPYGNGPALGSDNTFIGTSAGYNNFEGYANTFIGYNAGYSNTGYADPIYFRGTGCSNVFIGKESGYKNTIGYYNLFIGERSGYENIGGSYNMCLGALSGNYHTSGDYNIFIGAMAGYDDTSGVANVYIGRNAGENNRGSSNIFIGNRAGGSEANVSNKVFIDNTSASSTTAFIYGDLQPYNRFMRLNQKTGININPTNQLHVVDLTASNNNAAILGSNEVTDGFGIGVEGRGNLKGVRGYVSTTYTSTIYAGEFRGYNYGSGNTYGVYASGYSSTGTAYAGYFSGNVHITGTLSKGAGSFLIDHPDDPLHKTLRHNFVESPENLCLYRGSVQLDEEGKGTVKMPTYFVSLTKEEDATVSLTSIGQPFNVGYEWNTTFTEVTIYGAPNRKVSYIVLSDRDDPVMKQLYRPVEMDKNAKGECPDGKLMYPKAYGYGEESDVNYEHNKPEKK